MNHIYRTVWNDTLEAMVAVAEITSGRGRTNEGRARHGGTAQSIATSGIGKLSLAIAVGWGGLPAVAQVNPSGGVAIHGTASFSTPAPNKLVVTTQNGAGSSHSAINWQSFSIAPGNSTNFQQPSTTSTVINRVVTNTPSSIFGTLSSNGNVVLVNQSGIAVGAGAVVDTAGFTASALRMTDADALAGRLRFGDASAGLGEAAGVTVDGRITARDGDVTLIAPHIDMGASALIQAPNGSTLLAAGQQVEITGRGLEGITLLVQAPTDQVRNLGTLQGDAVGIFAGTLHHSGEIQATTASLEGGTVVLKATGDVYVEGAAKIFATGTVGGRVDVLGKRVAVTDQAVVDASGTLGGGAIRVGGDYQGKNTQVQNAQMSYLGAQASLKANATSSGNGGKVIVWADDVTRAHGSIEANAAAGGGGGFVETSGHRYLDVEGIRVAASGSATQAGTWLLDPSDVTIYHAVSVGVPVNMTSQTLSFGAGTQTLFTPVSLASTSTVSDAILNQALNTGSNLSVVVTTTNAGSSGLGAGDITFDNSISGNIVIDRTNNTNTNSGLLTFNADRNIVFGPGTTTFQRSGASTGQSLTIELNPGTSVAGKVLTNSGAGVVLNGVSDDLRVVVKNGKVWENSGTVTLNGQSLISLPNQTTYATFANLAGGVLNVNSASNWSFLSDSLNQGGILSNAGTVNVNGIAGGNTTSWEALYKNLAGGTLNIGAGKFLSMQNGGPMDGAISIGSGGTLRLSEQHTGGPPTFSNTAFSGSGTLVVGSPVTATFNNTSGSIEQLAIEGAAIVAGALSAKDYTQVTAGSSLTGVGTLNITRSFNHSTGSFAPTGNVSITQATGNLVFGDALNAGSVALSASTGNLTLNSSILASGTVALSAGSPGGVIIQSAGTITAAGATTVSTGSSGSVTLAQAGNDFTNLALASGAVSIVDANALTVTSLSSGANKAVSILAGGALTLPATAINTGTADLTLTSGGSMTVANALSGNNISLTGATGLTLNARVNAAGAFSASTTNAASTMAVNNIVTAGAAMNLTLAGGLVLQSGAGNDAQLQAAGTQTIAAKYVEVNAAGADWAWITTSGGANQSITTSGKNASGEGLVIRNNGSGNAVIDSSTGLQSVTVNNADFVRILGNLGDAALNNSVGQTLVLQGSGQNSLQVGSATAAGRSQINGASQTITAGQAGQLGNIQLRGGVTDGKISNIYNSSGAQSITTTGALTLVGGSASGIAAIPSDCANVGACAIIDNNTASGQTITAGAINLQGGLSGGYNIAAIQAFNAGASQALTVTGGGTLALTGGSGSVTKNNAAIYTSGSAQTINFSAGGNLQITGGTSGTSNAAQVSSNASSSTQTVSGATSITLTGGASGGGLGTGNAARLQSSGSQAITVGSGGLTLTGGASTLTDNAAMLGQWGLVGTSQTITVNGGGAITMTGGSSLATGVGSTHGSRALIEGDGDSQTINFSAGGAINLTGGTLGSRNWAHIYADKGSQTITGSAAITLTGGASGGIAGEGNSAKIGAQTGAQSISASGIVLQGGAAGTENGAQIYSVASQGITIGSGGLSLTGGGGSSTDRRNYASVFQSGLTGTSQTVTVGGGAITLQGGSSAGTNVGGDSNGSYAFITGWGDTQLVEFNAAGGSISATGGTVGSTNFAGIYAKNGTQTIRGSTLANAPAITLTGGASGGVAGEDNGAGFSARVGAQTISAGTTTLQGGAGGIGNSAYITAPTQTLSFNGNLGLTGGSNGDQFGGARIGGAGGATPSSTNLNLAVTGNLTLAGGSSSGVGIGATPRTTGLGNTIAITTSGDVSLNPSATQGVRIGSLATDIQSGSISITAGGNIALNSGGGTGFAGLRSLGNVVLSAANTGKTISEASGGLIVANQLTTSSGANTSLLGSNQVGTLVASSTNGNIAFSNTQSLTLGTIATGAGAQNVAISAIGGSSSLTLGAATSDDNWTLISGGALTLGGVFSANNISLTSGAALNLAQNLSATGNLSLITPNGSSITQSAGTITAGGQTALNAGSGDVTLIAAGNDFNQIGAIGGTVRIRDVNSASLGSSSVGKLVLQAGGNLTLNGPLAASGAGDAVALVSTAGTLDASAGSISTPSGRWLLYLAAPGASNFGSLTPAFKQYNATLASTILGTGNGLLYGLRPTITASLGTGTHATKVYDGNTGIDIGNPAITLTATGVQAGDTVTLGKVGAGVLDNKNVGAGKNVTTAVQIASASSGAAVVFGYNFLDTGTTSSSASAAIGDVTRANLTISASPVNRAYDGSSNAAASAVATGGTTVFAGDTLVGGNFAFLDKNAGTGKTVTVSGVTVNDGNGGANYNVTYVGNFSSSITPLAAATWSGSAGDSLWSSAGNWDVVPITGNVLSVTIPAGAGSVVFDTSAGATSLQSLSSQRPVSVTGGNLQIGASLSTPSYNQSGGAVTGSGSMTVAGSFTQSGGSVALGGIHITQSSGNLSFASLTAAAITLAAPGGAISQTGPLVAGSLVTASAAGTNLTASGNQIGAWSGSNQGSGNIALVNTGALNLASLGNTGGNIDVTNTGGFTSVGSITAPGGKVTITTNSPLTIGAGGVAAGGDIVLNATNLTSAGNLTLDGPITSGASVKLTAGSNMVQNGAVFGLSGVTASAGSGMSYGPLATTNNPPILYTVNGVTVPPPPTELLVGQVVVSDVVDFGNRFTGALEPPAGDATDFKADGTRKRKGDNAVVAEGEVCK